MNEYILTIYIVTGLVAAILAVAAILVQPEEGFRNDEMGYTIGYTLPDYIGIALVAVVVGLFWPLLLVASLLSSVVRHIRGH